MNDPEAIKPVLVIDGSEFDDLAGFARVFSLLLTDWTWKGSLDAFNDILRGGFGTPEDGFVLRWEHSDRSREALGWRATIMWLEGNLPSVHPTNRDRWIARIDAARRGEGQTLFDQLVEIIREHRPGGSQSGNIDLELV